MAVQSQSQTVVAQASAADEIKKLAELRDLGVLTEAEFQAKKMDVLGL